MEEKLARIKALITQREEIDAELAGLIGGFEKRKPRCSVCNEPGHRATACPTKVQQA